MRRVWMWWMSLIVLGWASCVTAQVDAAAEPQADEPAGVETLPGPPGYLASPRDTMRAFIASMESLMDAASPEYALRRGQDPNEVLRETLGIEPGLDAASVREVGIRLYAVLHRIDNFSGDLSGFASTVQLERAAAQNGTAPTRHQIWPWERSADGPLASRIRLIEAALARAGLDPEIALVESARDGRWVFSSDTIDEIDEFYDAVRGIRQDFGVSTDSASVSIWLERQMPEWALRSDFTLRNWQWIGLGVVIFAGFIVDLVSRAALLVVWSRLRRKHDPNPDLSVGRRGVRPFGLLIGATVWYFGVGALGLPLVWATVLQVAARAVLTLAGVMAAWRLTDMLGVLVLHQTQKTHSQIDDLLVPLARKTLKILVVIFGVMWIASSLNLNIAPVLAGLGVGGLAFAFAAKDTIENLFGSVAVILDRPFQVGDWVEVDGTEGTVEELGLRSTRIRTFYNSQVTVPNAALVRAVVDNYGRRRFRRYKTTLNVTYDTPPDSVEAFCEGIRELIRVHPYTRKDQYHVWMNDFGPHSLDILVYMFFECPDWATELRERHRFILDIVRLANRLGIAFAFPTQTLHLHNAGRTPEAEAIGDLAIDTERLARREGLKAAQGLTKEAIWRDVKPAPVAFPVDTKSDTEDLADDGDAGDGAR